MRLRHYIILFAGIFFSTPLYSASLDINLSDSSAQVRYSSVVGGSTMGRTEWGLGFLYTDEDNYVLDSPLLVVDVAGSKTPGLEIGVGPDLFYVNGNNREQTFSLTLGGRLRYKFAALPRFNTWIYGFYGPRITTFMDANSMYAVGVGIGYELLPTADVYVGYRTIEVDFVRGNQTIDDTWMVGMKFSF